MAFSPIKSLATIAAAVLALSMSACTSSGGPSFSEQVVRSEIARCPDGKWLDFAGGKLKWNYCAGLELKAFLDVAQVYDLGDVAAYAEAWYDEIIDSSGTPLGYRQDKYTLDHVCPARTLIPLYKATGKQKYMDAMRLVREQLRTQPRTAEGGYWHKAVYPGQIWLDGLYMAEPFLVEYAAAFGTPEDLVQASEESMNQFLTAARVTFDPATGLYRHAYDSTRGMFWCDPVSGQSAHCWCRALGWYCMALVDVFDSVSEGTPGRAEVLEIFRGIVDALPRWADPESGMWYQVMDCPGREGNYLEATGSAMFTYAVLKGVRTGLLDPGLKDYGLSCWQNLLKTFVSTEEEDGLVTLSRCCSVAGLGGKQNRAGDYAYYLSEPVRDNDPKGIAPLIWAALEIEKCKNNRK